MKITSMIHRAVREHVLFPIVGRVLDRVIRRIRGRYGWEAMASTMAHAMLESATGVDVRTIIAKVIRDVGAYLSPDSIEVLRLVDEIARKHSPEAN